MVDEEDFYEEFPCIPRGILNKNQIDVLFYYYSMGMSYSQIAEETGRNKRGVIKSKTQAMVKLEREVKLDEFMKKYSEEDE